MSKAVITFKPKQVTKSLLASLPTRAADILKRRYGLGDTAIRSTLEEIGKSYGITRERVRQIESFALATVRKSDAFVHALSVFDELKSLMSEYGTVVHEEDFLNYVSKETSLQNHVHFLLVLGDYFERLREDDDFYHRWTTDKTVADKVERSLRTLHKSLSANELLSEKEVLNRFEGHLEKDVKNIPVKNFSNRWISLSKNLGQNPLGEWGLASSSKVKARGIRDLAYLILRDQGSPMHFTEVAKQIEKLFNKKAHVATCHNELIKDERFILVGRGLYALAEWGYAPGVVRDVIRHILKKEGSMTKEEILDRVKKERYVKDNTIIVNLQNGSYFKKDKTGRYSAL